MVPAAAATSSIGRFGPKSSAQSPGDDSGECPSRRPRSGPSRRVPECVRGVPRTSASPPPRRSLELAPADSHRRSRPRASRCGSSASTSPRRRSRPSRPPAPREPAGCALRASPRWTAAAGSRRRPRHRARCRAGPCRSGSPGRERCRRSWRTRRGCPGTARGFRERARAALRFSGWSGVSAQARWLMTSRQAEIRFRPEQVRRLVHRQPEAVHAGIDLERRRARGGEPLPGVDLLSRTQHWPQIVLPVEIGRIRGETRRARRSLHPARRAERAGLRPAAPRRRCGIPPPQAPARPARSRSRRRPPSPPRRIRPAPPPPRPAPIRAPARRDRWSGSGRAGRDSCHAKRSAQP